MNYQVYEMYFKMKRMVAEVGVCENKDDENVKIFLIDVELGIKALEEDYPEILERYNNEKKMFATFTPEQQNFICCQIGMWYVLWKDKMWVDEKPNQHWLGTAKEQLKNMICGE